MSLIIDSILFVKNIRFRTYTKFLISALSIYGIHETMILKASKFLDNGLNHLVLLNHNHMNWPIKILMEIWMISNRKWWRETPWFMAVKWKFCPTGHFIIVHTYIVGEFVHCGTTVVMVLWWGVVPQPYIHISTWKPL